MANVYPESAVYRRTIPARCNRPATLIAANGYRTCAQHGDSQTPDAEPYDPDTVDDRFNTGRCDYPLDGLGAAPYRPLTC